MSLEVSIGDALGTDYFHLKEQAPPQQLDYLARTREFVQTDVMPDINGYRERAEFPWPLIEKLAKVGIVGERIKGYGCPDVDPMSAGLIAMEMARGHGSMATFLVVHGGLSMKSIFVHGSEEQKQRWLPPMARLEKIGAFALTEPDHGSDSVALETSAHRDGDFYVINGEEKWIGNGTIADVIVVWARDTEDGQVKGFLVEKDTPGYDARRIEHKVPLRAVWQAEIKLEDVRVPAETGCLTRTPSRTPPGSLWTPGSPALGARWGRRWSASTWCSRMPSRASSSASYSPASRSSGNGRCGCSPALPPCRCTACR
jgi:glutaryl-CoA dehydrogenase